MRIGILAPLAEPIPPSLYGGTERVVSLLVETLVDQGHDVTLFASGDSQTRARLVPIAPRGLRLDPEVRDLFAFRFEDFALEGYDPHPHIAAPVAV